MWLDRGVPGGELAGEGGPVQPLGEASTLPGGAQGAQPLGVGVSQVGAGDHNPLVRGVVAGRVVDVCRPEELGDLRWGGVPLGGGRLVLEPQRLGGSGGLLGQRLQSLLRLPSQPLPCRRATPPSVLQCTAAQRWRLSWWAPLAPWRFREGGRDRRCLSAWGLGRLVMVMTLAGSIVTILAGAGAGVRSSDDEGEDSGLNAGEGGGAVNWVSGLGRGSGRAWAQAGEGVGGVP